MWLTVTIWPELYSLFTWTWLCYEHQILMTNQIYRDRFMMRQWCLRHRTWPFVQIRVGNWFICVRRRLRSTFFTRIFYAHIHESFFRAVCFRAVVWVSFEIQVQIEMRKMEKVKLAGDDFIRKICVNLIWDIEFRNINPVMENCSNNPNINLLSPWPVFSHTLVRHHSPFAFTTNSVHNRIIVYRG